jgi:hypothetical protein
MSGETAFGIVLTVVSALTLLVVGVMFWWGAREDGREQRRIDARLRRQADERGESESSKRL